MAEITQEDAVYLAKTLLSFRDDLAIAMDSLEDEGDRVYFGSTNHADALKDISESMSEIFWDLVEAASKQRDLYAEIRQSNLCAAELRVRLDAKDEDIYIPGVFRCAKCDFQLIKSTLNFEAGTVTANDKKGDKCPNDGAPLWRVTYKEQYAEIMEISARICDEKAAIREACNLAYGLLWAMQPIDRRQHKDDLACRARETLLAAMSKQDQSDGITAARAALATPE